MIDDLQIATDIDPHNPRICRFTTVRTLYVGTKKICCAEDAKGLPLGEGLIGLSGIEKIQLIGHLLVVTRTEEREWKDLERDIKTVLTAYLVSAQALTPDDVNEKMMLMGRSTREKIQYLIDSQINPGAAEHGGSVEVVDLKDDNLYLRLHGGCQGCGAAEFTLKQGIEAIMKRAVPEIGKIIDLTNHSGGMSPYYRRPESDRPTSY